MKGYETGSNVVMGIVRGSINVATVGFKDALAGSQRLFATEVGQSYMLGYSSGGISRGVLSMIGTAGKLAFKGVRGALRNSVNNFKAGRIQTKLAERVTKYKNLSPQIIKSRFSARLRNAGINASKVNASSRAFRAGSVFEAAGGISGVRTLVGRSILNTIKALSPKGSISAFRTGYRGILSTGVSVPSIANAIGFTLGRVFGFVSRPITVISNNWKAVQLYSNLSNKMAKAGAMSSRIKQVRFAARLRNAKIDPTSINTGSRLFKTLQNVQSGRILATTVKNLGVQALAHPVNVIGAVMKNFGVKTGNIIGAIIKSSGVQALAQAGNIIGAVMKNFMKTNIFSLITSSAAKNSMFISMGVYTGGAIFQTLTTEKSFGQVFDVATMFQWAGRGLVYGGVFGAMGNALSKVQVGGGLKIVLSKPHIITGVKSVLSVSKGIQTSVGATRILQAVGTGVAWAKINAFVYGLSTSISGEKFSDKALLGAMGEGFVQGMAFHSIFSAVNLVAGSKVGSFIKDSSFARGNSSIQTLASTTSGKAIIISGGMMAVPAYDLIAGGKADLNSIVKGLVYGVIAAYIVSPTGLSHLKAIVDKAGKMESIGLNEVTSRVALGEGRISVAKIIGQGVKTESGFIGGFNSVAGASMAGARSWPAVSVMFTALGGLLHSTITWVKESYVLTMGSKDVSLGKVLGFMSKAATLNAIGSDFNFKVQDAATGNFISLNKVQDPVTGEFVDKLNGKGVTVLVQAGIHGMAEGLYMKPMVTVLGAEAFQETRAQGAYNKAMQNVSVGEKAMLGAMQQGITLAGHVEMVLTVTAIDSVLNAFSQTPYSKTGFGTTEKGMLSWALLFMRPQSWSVASRMGEKFGSFQNEFVQKIMIQKAYSAKFAEKSKTVDFGNDKLTSVRVAAFKAGLIKEVVKELNSNPKTMGLQISSTIEDAFVNRVVGGEVGAGMAKAMIGRTGQFRSPNTAEAKAVTEGLWNLVSKSEVTAIKEISGTVFNAVEKTFLKGEANAPKIDIVTMETQLDTLGIKVSERKDFKILVDNMAESMFEARQKGEFALDKTQQQALLFDGISFLTDHGLISGESRFSVIALQCGGGKTSPSALGVLTAFKFIQSKGINLKDVKILVTTIDAENVTKDSNVSDNKALGALDNFLKENGNGAKIHVCTSVEALKAAGGSGGLYMMDVKTLQAAKKEAPELLNNFVKGTIDEIEQTLQSTSMSFSGQESFDKLYGATSGTTKLEFGGMVGLGRQLAKLTTEKWNGVVDGVNFEYCKTTNKRQLTEDTFNSIVTDIVENNPDMVKQVGGDMIAKAYLAELSQSGTERLVQEVGKSNTMDINFDKDANFTNYDMLASHGAKMEKTRTGDALEAMAILLRAEIDGAKVKMEQFYGEVNTSSGMTVTIFEALNHINANARDLFGTGKSPSNILVGIGGTVEGCTITLNRHDARVIDLGVTDKSVIKEVWLGENATSANAQERIDQAVGLRKVRLEQGDMGNGNLGIRQETLLKVEAKSLGVNVDSLPTGAALNIARFKSGSEAINFGNVAENIAGRQIPESFAGKMVVKIDSPAGKAELLNVMRDISNRIDKGDSKAFCVLVYENANIAIEARNIIYQELGAKTANKVYGRAVHAVGNYAIGHNFEGTNNFGRLQYKDKSGNSQSTDFNLSKAGIEGTSTSAVETQQAARGDVLLGDTATGRQSRMMSDSTHFWDINGLKITSAERAELKELIAIHGNRGSINEKELLSNGKKNPKYNPALAKAWSYLKRNNARADAQNAKMYVDMKKSLGQDFNFNKATTIFVAGSNNANSISTAINSITSAANVGNWDSLDDSKKMDEISRFGGLNTVEKTLLISAFNIDSNFGNKSIGALSEAIGIINNLKTTDAIGGSSLANIQSISTAIKNSSNDVQNMVIKAFNNTISVSDFKVLATLTSGKKQDEITQMMVDRGVAGTMNEVAFVRGYVLPTVEGRKIESRIKLEDALQQKDLGLEDKDITQIVDMLQTDASKLNAIFDSGKTDQKRAAFGEQASGSVTVEQEEKTIANRVNEVNASGKFTVKQGARIDTALTNKIIGGIRAEGAIRKALEKTAKRMDINAAGMTIVSVDDSQALFNYADNTIAVNTEVFNIAEKLLTKLGLNGKTSEKAIEAVVGAFLTTGMRHELNHAIDEVGMTEREEANLAITDAVSFINDVSAIRSVDAKTVTNALSEVLSERNVAGEGLFSKALNSIVSNENLMQAIVDTKITGIEVNAEGIKMTVEAKEAQTLGQAVNMAQTYSEAGIAVNTNTENGIDLRSEVKSDGQTILTANNEAKGIEVSFISDTNKLNTATAVDNFNNAINSMEKALTSGVQVATEQSFTQNVKAMENAARLENGIDIDTFTAKTDNTVITASFLNNKAVQVVYTENAIDVNITAEGINVADAINVSKNTVAGVVTKTRQDIRQSAATALNAGMQKALQSDVSGAMELKTAARELTGVIALAGQAISNGNFSGAMTMLAGAQEMITDAVNMNTGLTQATPVVSALNNAISGAKAFAGAMEVSSANTNIEVGVKDSITDGLTNVLNPRVEGAQTLTNSAKGLENIIMDAAEQIVSGKYDQAMNTLNKADSMINNAIDSTVALNNNTSAVSGMRNVIAGAKAMASVMANTAKADIANTVNNAMTTGMNIAKADVSGLGQISQTVNVDGLMGEAKGQIVGRNYAKAEATLNTLETGLNKAVEANPTLGKTPAIQALRNVISEAKGIISIMPTMVSKADITNTVNNAMTTGMHIAKADASGMSQLNQTVKVDGLMTQAQREIASGNYVEAEATLNTLETGMNKAIAVNSSLANNPAVQALRNVIAEVKGMTSIMPAMATKADVANTVNNTMIRGMNKVKADASGMSQISQTVEVDGLMSEAKSEIVSGNYAEAEATLNTVENRLNSAVSASPSLGNTPAAKALRNVISEAKGMTSIMPAMGVKADIVNTFNSAMTIGMNIAKADAIGMSQLSQTVNVDGLMTEARGQIAAGNYTEAEAILNAVEIGVKNAVADNPILANTPAIKALRNVVAEAKGMATIMSAVVSKADIVNTVNSAITTGMSIAKSDAIGMSQLSRTVKVGGVDDRGPGRYS